MADSRPRLEAELASTEAQLRDTESGLNHYLRAFETGEMPAAICSPRVTELTQRRDELAAHRKKLTAQLKDATPQLPTPEQLRALCAEIRRTIDSGNPDAAKQLLRELIDRVEITPERHAYPYFWVPAGCETGTPSGKPGPDAPPVPSRQGDTGWLFIANRGGGGNRTRSLPNICVQVVAQKQPVSCSNNFPLLTAMTPQWPLTRVLRVSRVSYLCPERRDSRSAGRRVPLGPGGR